MPEGPSGRCCVCRRALLALGSHRQTIAAGLAHESQLIARPVIVAGGLTGSPRNLSSYTASACAWRRGRMRVRCR